MSDELAALGSAPGTRVYVATVTSVTENLLSVDTHDDGDSVDEIPWYGQTPQVDDDVVLLLSDGQLIALSMGRPS